MAFESFFLGNLVALPVEAFLLALTAIKDMKNILHSINAQCMAKKPQREKLQALKQVHEFIQLHAGLKKLSN